MVNVRLLCSGANDDESDGLPSWRGSSSRSTRSPRTAGCALGAASPASATGDDAPQATAALRRARQRGLSEERPERLGLQEMASPGGFGFGQVELREDRPRLGRPGLLAGAPEPGQPRMQVVVAVVGLEQAPNDELWRNRPVPAVRLEAERDVVAPLGAEEIELSSQAEADRAARVAAVAAYAEGEVLAFADRAQLDEAAARREQRHLGIPEPERRQPTEFLRELERQRGAAWQDGVDRDARPQVVVGERAVGVRRERLREELDALGADRPAAARCPPKRSR